VWYLNNTVYLLYLITAEPKLDSEGSVADHQFALSGAKYAKELHPIQDMLVDICLLHAQ